MGKFFALHQKLCNNGIVRKFELDGAVCYLCFYKNNVYFRYRIQRLGIQNEWRAKFPFSITCTSMSMEMLFSFYFFLLFNSTYYEKISFKISSFLRKKRQGAGEKRDCSKISYIQKLQPFRKTVWKKCIRYCTVMFVLTH